MTWGCGKISRAMRSDSNLLRTVRPSGQRHGRLHRRCKVMHQPTVKGVFALPSPQIDRRIDTPLVRAIIGGNLLEVKQLIARRPRPAVQAGFNPCLDLGIAQIEGPLAELRVVRRRMRSFRNRQVESGQVFQDPRPLRFLPRKLGMDRPHGQGHLRPIVDGGRIVDDQPRVEIRQAGNEILELPLSHDCPNLRARPLGSACSRCR